MSITKGEIKIPGRDGTGPMGMGTMAGRDLGACRDIVYNGTKRGFGYGLGYRCFNRRGYRRKFATIQKFLGGNYENSNTGRG